MTRWQRLMAVLVVTAALSSCGHSDVEPPVDNPGSRTYASIFPDAENPIHEDDNWVNGAATGLDWGDVATRPGLAYGLQDGSVRYADATAILRGSWDPDQTVEAVVHVGAVSVGDYPEVELRLRSSLSAHRCTGYEVQWGVTRDNPYFAIVRWNGAHGDFTVLFHESGSSYAVEDGDAIKATMIGSTIRAYTSGRLIAELDDGTFAAGNPGMGFNYFCSGNCIGAQDGYGLTAFSASSAPMPAGDAAAPESHGRE